MFICGGTTPKPQILRAGVLLPVHSKMLDHHFCVSACGAQWAWGRYVRDGRNKLPCSIGLRFNSCEDLGWGEGRDVLLLAFGGYMGIALEIHSHLSTSRLCVVVCACCKYDLLDCLRSFSIFSRPQT